MKQTLSTIDKLYITACIILLCIITIQYVIIHNTLNTRVITIRQTDTLYIKPVIIIDGKKY